MFRLKRTVTPARLAANRRAALKSTGPRTARGKSRSSLNALRSGKRSKTIDLLWQIMAEAPRSGVIEMARRMMTPAQLSHPDVTFMLNLCLSKGDTPIEPDPGGIQFLLDYLYGERPKTRENVAKKRVRKKKRSKPKSGLESTKV
jgi:hypothetical protein